jgi:hypothetical protein
MTKALTGSLGLFALLLLTACQKETSSSLENGALAAPGAAFQSNTNNPEGILFYALDGSRLDKYSTSNPETRIGSVTISGLQAGERLLDIDFRPKNGMLYGLGSNSRVYIINPTTGAASFAFSFRTTTGMDLSLSGTSVAFDFNPAADRLRIISNTGQNLRVVPDGIMGTAAGTTFVDGSINPSGAMLTGAAYDNNDNDPATGTRLFVLDASTDLLYKVDPPNAGTLTDAMRVKLKLEGDGGFDIAPRNAMVTTDIALALYEVNKKATLFQIDPATGNTRILAKYRKELSYTALAISPELP